MMEIYNRHAKKKIGITERSDPSLNFSWVDNMKKVDCAIIISKKINTKLLEYLLFFKDKIIFHHTITGLGASVIEPNIYNTSTAFGALDILVEKGFPKEQIVIRVDPIIPTEKYFSLAQKVITLAIKKEYTRLRFSFIDMYTHVKHRFINKNIELDIFDQHKYLKLIEKYSQYISLEACCEMSKFKCGCISEKDLNILKFDDYTALHSYKQRSECMCIGKTELIEIDKKQQCPYACIYCYWKD